MGVIVGICFVALTLLVWFDTDAFIEYVKLFKLEKWFKVDQFLEIEQSPDFGYREFLLEYHNNFFTRLIACPICTSVWLGFCVSIFTSLTLSPVFALGGLLLYKWSRKLIID